jgi:hypothetical protein
MAGLRRAAAGSLGAAVFLSASLAAIAEIDAQQTSEAGVLSSTWTPFRGIWSLLAGDRAFGGSWDFWPIALGLLVLVAVAVALGIAGIAVIWFLLGPAPQPPAAIAIGIAWGLAVQIVVVNIVVATVLGHLPAYDSLPHWGWWLGLGTWGAALGLIVSAPSSRSRVAGARKGLA